MTRACPRDGRGNFDAGTFPLRRVPAIYNSGPDAFCLGSVCGDHSTRFDLPLERQFDTLLSSTDRPCAVPFVSGGGGLNTVSSKAHRGEGGRRGGEGGDEGRREGLYTLHVQLVQLRPSPGAIDIHSSHLYRFIF